VATLWPWGRGESWYAGFARLRRVWRALTRSPERDIVVVTHHWFIWTLLGYLRLHPRWRIVHRDTHHAGISIAERNR
jgi:broad specificity phosphatase PhoE